MKKVFSILVLLFLVCNLAIAQQQEWVDKKYNFSSVKNVFVDYEVNNGTFVGDFSVCFRIYFGAKDNHQG